MNLAFIILPITAKKLTTYLKLEDGVEITLKTLRIYGAFNGWNYNNNQTQLLTDEDGDGIYTTMVELPKAVQPIYQLWFL